jgi:hypothetical protein
MSDQLPLPSNSLAAEIAVLKAAIAVQNELIQEIVRTKQLSEMPSAQQQRQRLMREMSSVTRRLHNVVPQHLLPI